MGLILFLIICFFIIFGVYLLQSGSAKYERPMPFAPSYVSPY